MDAGVILSKFGTSMCIMLKDSNFVALQLQLCSLVPRPLPDFISQQWRKIGRRPGTNTTSRTGNGGLG